MSEGDKPLGVILAGGEGRRIGGGKPFVTLGGRPLITHVIDRLAPQCARLAVNANGPADGFTTLGLPVIADGGQSGQGPLSGILAAMDWAAAQGASWVLTAPVDTPFLPMDLAQKLAAVHAPIVLAATADGVHGTCGLWDIVLRDRLADALAGGVRKVTAFTEAEGAVSVPFSDTDPHGFFNINSPDDLEAAKALLARR
jgi:molybdopterin-guanine dinucleotide biosynthesis protein A